MEDSSSQDEETTKEKVLSRRMKAFSVLNLFGYGSLWFAGENVALEFKEARPMDSLKYLKTVVAFANGRCLAHDVISAEASIHWPKGHRRKAAARVVPSLRSKWLQR